MKVGVPLGIVPMLLLLLLLLLSFAPGQEARKMRYGSGSFVTSFVQNAGIGGTRIKPVDNLKEGLNRLSAMVQEANWKGHRKAYACWNQKLVLKCPARTQIEVQTATLVPASEANCDPALLKSALVCPSPLPSQPPYTNELSYCNDQERCEVDAVSSMFSSVSVSDEYCWYLEVEYKCLKKANAEPKTAYARQSHTLVLECPADKHIKVQTANYGDPSGTISAFSDPATCDFDSTSIIATHCHGQTMCHIKVDDNLRTDGDSACDAEYLKVQYTCVRPDVCNDDYFRDLTVDIGYRGLDYFNEWRWIEMLMKKVQDVIDAADQQSTPPPLPSIK